MTNDERVDLALNGLIMAAQTLSIMTTTMQVLSARLDLLEARQDQERERYSAHLQESIKAHDPSVRPVGLNE